VDGSATNMSPAKGDSHQVVPGADGSSIGAAGGSDLGLKPSLLEEVLTDKKLVNIKVIQ